MLPILTPSLVEEIPRSRELMYEVYTNQEPEGLWKRTLSQLEELTAVGVRILVLPPLGKGVGGKESNGSDPHDYYDIGGYEQHGCVATKWGSELELRKLIERARELSIHVVCDIVIVSCSDTGSFNTASHMFKRDNTVTVTSPSKPGKRFLLLSHSHIKEQLLSYVSYLTTLGITGLRWLQCELIPPSLITLIHSKVDMLRISIFQHSWGGLSRGLYNRRKTLTNWLADLEQCIQSDLVSGNSCLPKSLQRLPSFLIMNCIHQHAIYNVISGDMSWSAFLSGCTDFLAESSSHISNCLFIESAVLPNDLQEILCGCKTDSEIDFLKISLVFIFAFSNSKQVALISPHYFEDPTVRKMIATLVKIPLSNPFVVYADDTLIVVTKGSYFFIINTSCSERLLSIDSLSGSTSILTNRTIPLEGNYTMPKRHADVFKLGGS